MVFAGASKQSDCDIALPTVVNSSSSVPQQSSRELDQLVAPIALYPDALNCAGTGIRLPRMTGFPHMILGLGRVDIAPHMRNSSESNRRGPPRSQM
jgi:hypothetical protein